MHQETSPSSQPSSPPPIDPLHGILGNIQAVFEITSNAQRLPRIAIILEAIRYEIRLQQEVVDDAEQRAGEAEALKDIAEEASLAEEKERPELEEALKDANQVLEDAEEVAETEQALMGFLEEARDALLEFTKASNEDPV